MAVKWKWNNNTGGGNVPAGLENRVQTLENEAVKKTGDQSIAGAKTFTNKITANEGLSTADTKAITAGNLELGKGDTTAYITPEDTSTKTLKFGGRSGRGRFDLDLETTSLLKGVKDPTANYHAANKLYVDNKVKTRTQNNTVNVGTTLQITPTGGYQIINVIVGRKRTQDSAYFFEYQSTLNKQVFINSSNVWCLYNEANVSGFNNEFKIIITEMKV